MAFDFNMTSVEDPAAIAGREYYNGANLKLGEILNTDAHPEGDNTGREYLESRGYFDARDKYLVVDPMPYLKLYPATGINFGVTILEPGKNDLIYITDEDLGKPQLVFQQVYGEVTKEGVKVSDRGQLLHFFVGICKIIKGDDGKYSLIKLWDIFIFDPHKVAKY